MLGVYYAGRHDSSGLTYAICSSKSRAMLKTIKRHVVHIVRLTQQRLHNLKHRRSSKWPSVEHIFLKNYPRCAACDSTKHVQVHHRKPFHLYPELELEPTNLIGLCMSIDHHCHLHIGHGGNFKAWNPHVEQDSRAARLAYLRSQLLTVQAIIAAAKRSRRMDNSK